jgi:N-acetylglucosaminyl-diphospho-decaprenol L-rhamnosyltransferase
MVDGARPGAVVALVLHYRDGALTARCLRSLRADGVGQVVVVDNSADAGRSWEEARRVLAADDGLPPAWVRLDPGVNLGFAAGVNLGLREARRVHPGCAVLLLNSDAQVEPGMTARLLAAVPAETAALVAPAVLDEHGRAQPSPQYYLPALALHAAWPRRATLPYLSGCALLLAPALLRSGVELDEAFFFYGEDVELSARVARAGGHLLVVPEARCRHRGSGSSRRYSHFYEYHLVRGQRLLARRLVRPWWWRWLTLPPRELLLAARACWHAVRARSAAPLAGWLGRPPAPPTRAHEGDTPTGG